MNNKIRVNIFLNGDHRRQNGRVLILDSSSCHWDHFVRQALSKLLATHSNSKNNNRLDDSISKLRVYSSQGGLVESLDDLIQDDVLFFSQNGEAFNYQIVAAQETTSCLTTFDNSNNNNNDVVVAEDQIPNCPEVQEELARRIFIQFKQVNGYLRANNNNNSNNTEMTKPKEELIFRTDMNRSKTILSAKKWLSKRTGCHIDDISLIMKGHMLKDEQLLTEIAQEELNVNNHNNNHTNANQLEPLHITMFMLIKPMVLYVKKLRGGSSTTVLQQPSENISHETLVRDVKNMLLKKIGIDEMKLMFNQKILSDGEQLSTYGVMSGAVLFAL